MLIKQYTAHRFELGAKVLVVEVKLLSVSEHLSLLKFYTDNKVVLRYKSQENSMHCSEAEKKPTAYGSCHPKFPQF